MLLRSTHHLPLKRNHHSSSAPSSPASTPPTTIPFMIKTFLARPAGPTQPLRNPLFADRTSWWSQSQTGPEISSGGIACPPSPFVATLYDRYLTELCMSPRMTSAFGLNWTGLDWTGLTRVDSRRSSRAPLTVHPGDRDDGWRESERGGGGGGDIKGFGAGREGRG